MQPIVPHVYVIRFSRSNKPRSVHTPYFDDYHVQSHINDVGDLDFRS